MQNMLATLLLMALCLFPATALCEQPAPEASPPQASEEPAAPEHTPALPEGKWMVSGDDQWFWMLEGDTELTEAQRMAAAQEGIPQLDGTLPAGTSLSLSQLALLYPGVEAAPSQPKITPPVEQFSLTGEWFYGADGVLYYRHGEGYRDMPMDEVFQALGKKAVPQRGEKTIYLTIDDSPGPYTMDLLAVLNALDVKATFFVVGAYVRQFPVQLKAIHDLGHGIANHSYSHDAAILSASYRSCLSDFQKCEEAVAQALGFPLSMPILRVPYGASTLPVSFRTQLQKDGYLWIDWNALNGDTESAVNSDKASLERAFSTAGRYDGTVVLLVHDGKKRTIRTLPELVAHFRDLGYEFRVLTPDVGRIDGVRMGLPK